MRSSTTSPRRAVAVALLIVGVLAGLVVTVRGGGDTPTEVGAPESSAMGNTPVNTESSDPNATDRAVIEEQAVGVAVELVASTGAVASAGPLTRRDTLLAIATDDYGDTLVESVDRDLDDLTVALGERSMSPSSLLWVEYPLTADATLDQPGRVRVQVWSVLVVGVEGASVARQVWRTSTITLESHGGDWKVADWGTTSGPSPASAGDADVASVEALREVSQWREVDL